MTVFRVSGTSSVTIDGRNFVGRSISIDKDGTVIVDGVGQEGKLVGPVSVTVQGDADSVETGSGRIDVKGSAGGIKTMSGDVHCGDVTGSVSTMSGDVNASKIGGSVSTMSGDIRGARS